MQSINNIILSDEPYLDLLPKVDLNPIFIMGDHRSGTTLLYKILVATGCFNFIWAYHIIKYNEILSNHINKTEAQAIQELEELLKALGISDRAIDQVMVTPDLPEEYGFILKNVAGDESYVTPKNALIFQQLCQKIQSISDPDKPLLLKNPWDFSKFIYIKRLIPNAKFIFIHRHPVLVINSKLKAIRTLLSSWNPYTALISRNYAEIFKNPFQRYLYKLLYSNYFSLGLRRVATQSVESTTYFLDNIESLSKKDYLCLRYEDLCSSPEAAAVKILEFLELKSSLAVDYEGLIELRPLKLLPEVQRNYDEICQKLKPYLIYHDYDV